MDGPDAGNMHRQLIHDALGSEVAAVLGIPHAELDLSRSLDECGLDSIDAVVAAGALGRRLGIDLPAELLIQHRRFDDIVDTVARLSRKVRTEPATPTVFLFAGWGGRDPRLRRLADRCRPAVPSRIVMLGAWQDWTRLRLRLEDLVARAADEIEAASPAGPLWLGGYSQGAAMAFAVTRNLQDRGRTVASLSLFDAMVQQELPRPDGGGAVPLAAGRRAARFGRRWATSLFRRNREPGMLRTRLATALFLGLPPAAARPVRHVLARIPALLGGRGGMQVDNLMQMYVFALLWADWLPGATAMPDASCRTWLFRSADAEASDLGWGAFCPALTVVPVPGDHQTMFDAEHLDGLAAKFVLAVGGGAGLPGQPT